VPVTVNLTTCSGLVCKVAVNGSSDGAAWGALMERFNKLSTLLAGSHGDRVQRTTKRMKDCTQKMRACFAAGRGHKEATWRWPDKQSVSLVLSGGPVAGAPELRVFYYSAAYKENP
jgi:hypothetical protein